MATVSALVCTRNRTKSLLCAVRSLLASPSEFELIVIDQSDGPETEQALLEFRSDARLRHVRMGPRGKGQALNEGLRLARGSVVVCTDDDCEAPPGWVAAMAGVMETQHTTAVVFCNVIASPYDRTTGYIPYYERSTDRRLSSLIDARNGLGLGAGMALRRDAVLGFGGFDESFGPGSRFGSADDWDISVRALLSGWHVYETAHVSILHHGFRTLEEGRTHALRDWIAIGALCAKTIQAGYMSAVPLALWLFCMDALWPPVRDLFALRRPSGGSRIVGFIRGFTRGLGTRVDARTLRFQSAD